MDERQAKLLNDHLIVALDVDTMAEAEALVTSLRPYVEKFKIGSRMFTAVGPAVLDRVAALGGRVFLDLKYHDIPSVVGDAVRVVASEHPSVFMLTVHASGGAAMVASAAEAAATRPGRSLRVAAVTALTSLSPAETRILGITQSLEDWALKLAELALEAGADGMVCSARETALMRERFGDQATIVTPGIRASVEDRRPGDDQARITTPRDALASGSTYLVMGRPVYAANDPAAALRAVGESL